MNKKEAKEKAQDEIMGMIANTLLSYIEHGENNEAVCEEIKKQADRIAKLFGYKEAWHN